MHINVYTYEYYTQRAQVQPNKQIHLTLLAMNIHADDVDRVPRFSIYSIVGNPVTYIDTTEESDELLGFWF